MRGGVGSCQQRIMNYGAGQYFVPVGVRYFKHFAARQKVDGSFYGHSQIVRSRGKRDVPVCGKHAYRLHFSAYPKQVNFLSCKIVQYKKEQSFVLFCNLAPREYFSKRVGLRGIESRTILFHPSAYLQKNVHFKFHQASVTTRT